MPHPFLPLNGAAILFALIATVVADERPPNLIYIMCDDLGYGDLGCFGQETIQTPRIDALAREGMRLTCYYAGCTVCRPSRLVLWTGQHTGHTPVSSNAQYVFRPEDVTVAELLQDAGYATGGVGKWVMGGVGTPGHPNRQGFDFWFGFLNQSEAHNQRSGGGFHGNNAILDEGQCDRRIRPQRGATNSIGADRSRELSRDRNCIV